MLLSLDEQSRLIEQSALQWLGAEYDFARRRHSLSHALTCPEHVWSAFAQMGWLALPIPDAAGGLGGRLLDVGLLMRTMGRHLVVEPFAPCVLQAARLLALHATPVQSAWLTPLIEGRRRAVLAHDEPAQHDPTAPRLTQAVRTADGWQLRGAKLLVAGAPGADWCLISASLAPSVTHATNGVTSQRVFRVPADHPGLTMRACTLANGTRAADLQFNQLALAPDALIGPDTDAAGVLHRVLAEAGLAACWEASGAMQALFDLTRQYTAQREQFGHALAQFQVVAHRLAEIAVKCEEALAACQLATLCAERNLTELDHAYAMARSKLGRCAEFVSRECVQLHGAMGVSDDYPAASYFRALDAFRQYGGPTRQHSIRWARLMLENGNWRLSRTLPQDETPSSPTAPLRLEAV